MNKRPQHTIKKEVVTTQYVIDASKIENLHDVKAILTCMPIVVWDDGSDKFKDVRHLYEGGYEEKAND